MTHSRRKGAGGEREVRDVLRSHNIEARRDGRLDEDLDHGLVGYHLEVKRRERYEIDSWLAQAERDAGDRIPVVVFRKSREPWRVILRLDDWLESLTSSDQDGSVHESNQKSTYQEGMIDGRSYSELD